MRWAYHAGLILLLAACENPSVLDDQPEMRPSYPWRAIAAQALWLDPISPPIDMHSWEPTDQPSNIARLVAWAEAKGRLGRVDVDGQQAILETLGITAMRVARLHAEDDRALEAALYIAQRMRRDESNLGYGAIAAAIASNAAKHRAHAPAFAARYAPTDDEVLHVFAGEAEWVASRYPELANENWAWLGNAPRDREGFIAALQGHPDTEIYSEYARKMYAAVDDYQRWLAR